MVESAQLRCDALLIRRPDILSRVASEHNDRQIEGALSLTCSVTTHTLAD